MLKPGLVRLILATLVVLFHITKFIFIGELAVFCFFILSGYWVTLMYENKYSHIKNPICTFYISRLCRLLPVFYLITFLTFGLITVFKPYELNRMPIFGFESIRFWLANIFLVGYNQISFKPLVPAWSLDIEMQFYLILPILIPLMKPKTSRYLFIVVTFLVSLILMLFWSGTFVGNTILKYLVYFLIGMTIFKSKINFHRNIEICFNVIFGLILVLHYCIPNWFLLIKDPHNQYNAFFNFLMPLLLIPFLSNSVLRKSNSTDMILGNISYTLYLSHWMFIIPYNYYIKDISKIERIPYTLLYLVVTYVFSFMVFKYFDEPLDKMRKRWVSKKVVKQAGLIND